MFTRRNPFVALEAGGNLRFEQLSLIGIVYSPDPSASVAILSTGGVSVADDGTMSAVEGDGYYAKVGERIGNVTIREIQRDRVIVTSVTDPARAHRAVAHRASIDVIGSLPGAWT